MHLFIKFSDSFSILYKENIKKDSFLYKFTEDFTGIHRFLIIEFFRKNPFIRLYTKKLIRN